MVTSAFQSPRRLPVSYPMMIFVVMALVSPSMVTNVVGQDPFDISNRIASRLRDTEVADYSCKFTNSWSAARHPNLYPNDGSAHWSPPIVASHNMNYTMWEDGGLASPGVERVAEAGIVSMLRNELLNLPLGTAGEFVIGDDQFNDEVQEQTFEDISMHPNTNMLSSITMIAPSPDWFSGFYNVDMLNDFTSTWLRSISITVYPWDSGTETGDTYSLGNPPEMPHLPISQLTIDTIPNTTNVFLDPTGTTVLPVGEFSCEILNEPVCQQTGMCMTGLECCSGRCFNNICLRRRPSIGKTGISFGAKQGRGGAAGRVRGGASPQEVEDARTQPLGQYPEDEGGDGESTTAGDDSEGDGVRRLTATEKKGRPQSKIRGA